MDKTFKIMTLRSASRFSKSCKKFRSYKNIGVFLYKLSPGQLLCLLGNTVCNFKIHSFSFCFLLNVINASIGPCAVLPLSSFSKIRNIHGAFLMMMMMMMMMMNCFCGMVDQRNGFSLISNQNHCQRSSPLRISDRLQVRFKPAQNSGLVE